MADLFPTQSDVLNTPRGPSRDALAGKYLSQITSDVPALARRSRAVITPILEKYLGPELAQSLARQAGRPGASIEGVLSGLATTGGFEVAQQLSGIQSEIARVKAGLPRNQDIGTAAAVGGASGFATGGPIGALAGIAGGILGANSANKAKNKAKARAREAGLAATPQAFGNEVAKQAPTAREAALAGGAGARSAQNLEAAITASGLRDTGLGTLASIAAGVQVPLEGLSQAFSAAMQTITRRVETKLSSPIRPPSDNLAKALEGIATAALLKGKTPTQKNSAFSTGLGSGQGNQTGFDIPLFTPATDPGYTSASGSTFSGNY